MARGFEICLMILAIFIALALACLVLAHTLLLLMSIFGEQSQISEPVLVAVEVLEIWAIIVCIRFVRWLQNRHYQRQRKADGLPSNGNYLSKPNFKKLL